MNETDLRVIKTKESIEQAFLSLLATKPLQKISIVELAREARINKGTFYLHYTDIFDLYEKTVRHQMEAGFEPTCEYIGWPMTLSTPLPPKVPLAAMVSGNFVTLLR